MWNILPTPRKVVTDNVINLLEFELAHCERTDKSRIVVMTWS